MALQQTIDRELRELALFAGAGGGILGGKLLGWRTVCAVEVNAYARDVLLARQDDGSLPPFPVWDDVRTFDGRPWRGIVDVVSGGFPCQDISVAGKGEGITGKRSGLWGHMRRIIRQVRPPFAFVENSPALTGRGLGTVLGDLAALGYDARWGVVSAADAIWLGGAPCLDHLRERIWIVAARADAVSAGWEEFDPAAFAGREEFDSGIPDAPTDALGAGLGCGPGRARGSDPGGAREQQQTLCADAHGHGAGCERPGPAQPAGRIGDVEPAGGMPADADGGGRCGGPEGGQDQQPWRTEVLGPGDEAANGDGIEQGAERGVCVRSFPEYPGGHWWGAEPGVGRVVHGVAHRVDRIGALGNGQVPAVVRLAWHLLAPKNRKSEI